MKGSGNIVLACFSTMRDGETDLMSCETFNILFVIMSNNLKYKVTVIPHLQINNYPIV